VSLELLAKSVLRFDCDRRRRVAQFEAAARGGIDWKGFTPSNL
jgi:hypothetical protein